MKTTRRGFLGVVAGLVALVGLDGKAQAAPPKPPALTFSDDKSTGVYSDSGQNMDTIAVNGRKVAQFSGGLTVLDAPEDFQSRIAITPSKTLVRWDGNGNLTYIADELVNDAIAQARAEGYNRGLRGGRSEGAA